MLVAHLGLGQKMGNIERDPRVGTITEGGAPELLQGIAPRLLGEGVKFPPMDNPPPGRVIHIAVERVAGAGPLVS